METFELEQKLNDFLNYNDNNNFPIAIVTSGGTKVALEKNTVRFIDNFSRGDRGALSAESFIAEGYSVIFLYRNSTATPFTTIIRDKICNQVDNDLLDNFVIQVIQHNRLFMIRYEFLHEYLKLLQFVCEYVRPYKSKVIIYLAAAVSDFYIPDDEMAEHKIQSSGGALTLNLLPVPKKLKDLTSVWAKDCFVVSFKLETDMDILLHKANKSIKNYNVHMVVANELHSRKDTVYVVSPDEVVPVIRVADNNCIESQLILLLSQYHWIYHKKKLSITDECLEWTSKSNKVSHLINSYLNTTRLTSYMTRMKSLEENKIYPIHHFYIAIGTDNSIVLLVNFRMVK